MFSLSEYEIVLFLASKKNPKFEGVRYPEEPRDRVRGGARGWLAGRVSPGGARRRAPGAARPVEGPLPAARLHLADCTQARRKEENVSVREGIRFQFAFKWYYC